MGEYCSRCKSEIWASLTDEEKKLRKSKNAFDTIAKRKERGTKLGRPKLVDDLNVALLSRDGLSIRKIAKLMNVSASTIQSSLKRQGL